MLRAAGRRQSGVRASADELRGFAPLDTLVKAIVEGGEEIECAEVEEGERGVFLFDHDGQQVGYVPYDGLERVIEHRTPVSSSNLRSVGYDENDRTLEIEFHSGGVYEYYDVPPETVRELLQAGSRGRYFHEHVRDEYDYRQIA